MPVDYLCPLLIPLELTLLDPDGLYTAAVNRVLKEYAPIDLIASVQQYHHYKETQYSIQHVANHFQLKKDAISGKGNGDTI